MSLSHRDERRDFDHVSGLNTGIPGWLAAVKSLPCNGPSYHALGVRGRLRFDRSLPRRGIRASEAQGFSGEAMKGNPTTTVILRVDESKITPEGAIRTSRTAYQ